MLMDEAKRPNTVNLVDPIVETRFVYTYVAAIDLCLIHTSIDLNRGGAADTLSKGFAG